MADENSRDGLIRSLDGIRATATKVEHELMELQHIVRFDHQCPAAKARAEKLQRETSRLSDALRQVKEHYLEGVPG